MLNNQPGSVIHSLPAESFPQDLLTSKLIEERWQSVSNEPAIWQNLINQHFPYLSQQNQSLYQTEPKTLFIKKFQRLDSIIKNHPEYTAIKQYLFASLRGEIEKIEKSEIGDKAKEQLYIYTAANGHLAGLNKLNEEAKGEALKLAAKKGHLNIIEFLLTQAGQQIPDGHKAEALRWSAIKGHHQVVQVLLIKAGQLISTEHKGMMLRLAAANGHHEATRVFLTIAGQQISAEHKGVALLWAAEHGHVEVAQTVLTLAGQEISDKDKGQALMYAAHSGHHEVAQAVLNLAGSQISAEDMCKALKYAAREGHQNIVFLLLEREGHQLPMSAVIQALGFFPACKFYASLTAKAIGNVWASLVPSTPVEQPPLPPVTTEPLTLQSELPPPTLEEVPTNNAKRKQGSSSESTNNEMNTDDESLGIKRAKFR